MPQDGKKGGGKNTRSSGHKPPFYKSNLPKQKSERELALGEHVFLVHHPTIKSDTLFLAIVHIGNCLFPEPAHWHHDVV